MEKKEKDSLLVVFGMIKKERILLIMEKLKINSNWGFEIHSLTFSLLKSFYQTIIIL